MLGIFSKSATLLMSALALGLPVLAHGATAFQSPGLLHLVITYDQDRGVTAVPHRATETVAGEKVLRMADPALDLNRRLLHSVAQQTGLQVSDSSLAKTQLSGTRMSGTRSSETQLTVSTQLEKSQLLPAQSSLGQFLYPTSQFRLQITDLAKQEVVVDRMCEVASTNLARPAGYYTQQNPKAFHQVLSFQALECLGVYKQVLSAAPLPRMGLAPLPSSVRNQNHRQGFTVVAGVGGHMGTTQFDTRYHSGAAEPQDVESLYTAIKIGGHVNPQAFLYYIRQAAWFRDEQNQLGNIGLTGIGSTYYFSPQNPSFYIEGAMGIGDLNDSDQDNPGMGSALSTGFGYEFNARFDLGAVILHTNTKRLTGDTRNQLSSVFALQLQAKFF